jgi:hypothetical protein
MRPPWHPRPPSAAPGTGVLALAATPAPAEQRLRRPPRRRPCNHAPPTSNPVASVQVGTSTSRPASRPRSSAAWGASSQRRHRRPPETTQGKKLAAIKRSGPWDFWRQYRTNVPQHPHQGGAEQNPVLWRSDRFVCTYAGPMLASGLISLKGELPKWDDDKRHWFTIVHLVDRITGQRLAIVNVHMIHGAVKGGGPVPGEPRHWDVRHPDDESDQRSEAAGVRPGLLVTGDYNAGWVADVASSRTAVPRSTPSTTGPCGPRIAQQRERNARGRAHRPGVLAIAGVLSAVRSEGLLRACPDRRAIRPPAAN